MIVGKRLRELRKQKNLSQGDIQKRSGLLRCYLSRVENGHTVPGVETLEKIARALEAPLYRLFYDGEEPPQAPRIHRSRAAEPWGSSGEDARFLTRFRILLGQMEPQDHRLLLFVVQKMARTNGGKRKVTLNSSTLPPKDESTPEKREYQNVRRVSAQNTIVA